MPPLRRAVRRPAPDVAVVLIAAAVTVVVTIAAVAVRVAASPGDRLPRGVVIAGVAVGGLTAEEARRAVARAASPPAGSVTIVRDDGGPPLVVVPVERLAAAPRIHDAVRRAQRTPPVMFRVRRQLGLGGRRDVALRYSVRKRVLEKVVRGVARDIERPPRSARLLVSDEGRRLRILAGADGRVVDEGALRDGLRSLRPVVTVRATDVAPEITDGEARDARRVAIRLTRAPVTVRAGTRSLVVPPRLLRRALTVRVGRGAISPGIAPRVVAPTLRRAFRSVERPAADADFKVRYGTVSVVPSSPGRTVDVAATTAAITRAPGGVVRLRVARVRPALTTAEARALRITRIVSEFRTPYLCCQPRVTNIARAAEILDGTILRPGQVFSLNRALGERTPERGFVPAPQIVAGRLEDAVGGGISQVATTVFNAAFFAGLRLIAHTPHEFWISRYPPGREATVSWGGPELIFQNDWPAGLLIRARAERTGIRVRMYSSRLGRRVLTETTGNAAEGTAFSVAYSRRILRDRVLRTEERYTWSYRAPPPPDA